MCEHTAVTRNEEVWGNLDLLQWTLEIWCFSSHIWRWCECLLDCQEMCLNSTKAQWFFFFLFFFCQCLAFRASLSCESNNRHVEDDNTVDYTGMGRVYFIVLLWNQQSAHIQKHNRCVTYIGCVICIHRRLNQTWKYFISLHTTLTMTPARLHLRSPNPHSGTSKIPWN